MEDRRFPRLLIAGMRKSSGKTTLTLGLAAALRSRGTTARLYKKGPDYIDPMWHRIASGQVSHNLDTYLMGAEACLRSFATHSPGFDLSLVEGNMGLHDGLDPEGEHSSAGLAKLLRAPVLLVVDSTGMNRNVAAIVYGMQNFDPQVAVAGVVLNQVRSARQSDKQVQAIERACGIPVLGCLPRQDRPPLLERQMGLVTPQEEARSREIVRGMEDLAAEHLHLKGIREIAEQAPPLPAAPAAEARALPTAAEVRFPSEGTVRLGVAYDSAFCFYYQDNLDALQRAGAELVYFDTLHDAALPQVDGLYFGGGFPESFMAELAANRSLRGAVAEAIEAGLPTYAECGGMMYLARSFIAGSGRHEMVGVLPADVRLLKRPAGYGYVALSPSPEPDCGGWLGLQREIRGHEFHYSELVDLEPRVRFAYAVQRGTGMAGQRDGIVYKNLLASYAHLHAATVPEWAPRFVAQMRKSRGD